MIQFADITHELAVSEWARYQECAGNDRIGQVVFGKLVVWCEEREAKERLPRYARIKKEEPLVKYIRRSFGLEKKLNPHTYKYGKVFRAVRACRFPSLSELDYDLLSKDSVQELSNALERDDLTNDEVAQMIVRGTVGHEFLRPRCKDINHPRGGYIYIMGLSAELMDASTSPVWFKLGGTRLDPYRRGSHIDREQCVFPGSLTVYAWSAEVSDWKQAELALQAPFRKLPRRARDYFQVRWEEVFAHAKQVGHKFAKKSSAQLARDRCVARILASL